MKNVYLLIVSIILFSNHLLVSQTNWSIHSYDDYPSQLVKVNNFSFFTTIIGGNFNDSTIISGVNENGKVKFRHHINLGEYAKVNSSIKTVDNCLLVIGEQLFNCDVSSLNKECFILKIDTNGYTQFMNTTVVTYTTNAQLEPFTTVV